MQSYTSTLCLNMIVKNESRIIRRLLESVLPIIDSYCICDTGSTDNTIDIIENFFKERQIPGKIIQEPFRDFGYNRTVALNACATIPREFGQVADYILLLDADMVFTFASPKKLKQQLSEGDVHQMFQGTEQFFYKNTRIVRNNCGCSYWGVTHEYLEVPQNLQSRSIEKSIAFIRDIGDGGSKSDKFLRDIRLLKRGLVDHPGNIRYTFYLANSLRDYGDTDEAIETYKKRISLGGWIEEVWHSHYSIGNIYKKRGDMPNAIYAWLDAYQCFPDRIESLYEIVHHYRCLGKYRLAYPYYVLAKNELNKRDKYDFLFTQKDVYDYKLDYEMTILGYYCNTDSYDLVTLSMKVLNYPYLDESIFKNVLSNFKFYAKNIRSIGPDTGLEAILKTIGVEKVRSLPDGCDFVSSTPALYRYQSLSDKYIVNVRFVNYSITDNGQYTQKSTIETKNVLATVEYLDQSWRITNEVFVQYDTALDNYYVGLEDVRLFSNNQNETVLTYNANRGLVDGTMAIETGNINILTGMVESYKILQTSRKIEKNWVFIQENEMIYGWWPLVIGTVQGNTFEKTREINTPASFKHLRGSTNGIQIGNEIWFICHNVSYEYRRYYYHMFVVLDAKTYEVVKYSPYFTFEKEKVEYTLGFTYDIETNTFLIGYSIMDKQTKYMSIAKNTIDKLILSI